MATRFRRPGWLRKNGYAPQVFLFRNIESGQVLYSQLPKFSDYQIKRLFQRPNWENKRPSTRRDIWRIMAVANFENYERAVAAYEALVEIRHMREVTKRKEAEALRKRNEFGNIWFSGQFRPGYTQEAVADLSSVIETLKYRTTVFWEDYWRKGDGKYWSSKLSRHHELPRVGTREQIPML
ncbi:mitochondrial 54S ribosomal protein mL67, partial [Ascoidea rubescens DSM 1968]